MDPYDFRDQLSIDTPEQVDLHLPVAGLGSRFLAMLIDLSLQSAAYTVLLLIVLLFSLERLTRLSSSTVGDRETLWISAAVIFVHFLFFWGYYTLFEAFWRGQTPGKRFVKIAVLKDSGRQITLFESMARNFVRILDALPAFYAVGVISMLASRQNKRLGDLLAGTIVVHREPTATSTIGEGLGRTFTSGFVAPAAVGSVPDFGVEFPPECVARLSPHDLLTMESFFARLPELDFATAERIAGTMLQGFCATMQTAVPPDISVRRSLDSLAYQLRATSNFRA